MDLIQALAACSCILSWAWAILEKTKSPLHLLSVPLPQLQKASSPMSTSASSNLLISWSLSEMLIFPFGEKITLAVD